MNVVAACGIVWHHGTQEAKENSQGQGKEKRILTPVSAIKGLPYLLHQGEVLSLRDHHKRILRPILGLGRDRYVFPVYHPCWLVTTPGVLISGHIGVGVIFSGRKGGYL